MNTGLRRFLAFSLGLIVVGKSSGQVLIPSLSRVFNNPTPEASEGFGFAVAALGTGRVVIGAFQDNAGAPAAGAAYLFSTNGTLVCTFTNPTPAASDGFGRSVAAVGSDKLVISGCWAGRSC